MVHATLIFMVLTLYSRSLILWFMIHTAHSIPLLSHCLVDETLKEHTNSLLDTIPSNGRFLETPQIVWKIVWKNIGKKQMLWLLWFFGLIEWLQTTKYSMRIRPQSFSKKKTENMSSKIFMEFVLDNLWFGAGLFLTDPGIEESIDRWRRDLVKYMSLSVYKKGTYT